MRKIHHSGIYRYMPFNLAVHHLIHSPSHKLHTLSLGSGAPVKKNINSFTSIKGDGVKHIKPLKFKF